MNENANVIIDDLTNAAEAETKEKETKSFEGHYNGDLIRFSVYADWLDNIAVSPKKDIGDQVLEKAMKEPEKSGVSVENAKAFFDDLRKYSEDIEKINRVFGEGALKIVPVLPTDSSEAMYEVYVHDNLRNKVPYTRAADEMPGVIKDSAKALHREKKYLMQVGTIELDPDLSVEEIREEMYKINLPMLHGDAMKVYPGYYSEKYHTFFYYYVSEDVHRRINGLDRFVPDCDD